MGKLRANSEIISDKSKNPVTTSTYIKHGNQWLDDAVNNAIGAAASKADKTYVDSEVAKKANKSEVDAALAGKANKSEVDAAIENAVDKRFLNFITPEMFGAVGDAEADDTVAVQQAFNQGGTIYLSKIYKITTPINIVKSNTTVFGNGTLYGDLKTTGAVLRCGSTADNVKDHIRIRDIHIRSTSTVVTTGIGVTHEIPSGIGNVDVIIEGVDVDGVSGNGIQLHGGTPTMTTIRPFIIVQNCKIFNCGRVGLCMSRVSARVSGNLFRNNGYENITVDNGCYQTSIINNNLQTARGGCGNIGIDQCDRCIVTGNNITSFDYDPAHAHHGGDTNCGIRLNCNTGHVTNTVISNNTFTGGKYGIWIGNSNTKYFGSGVFNGNHFVVIGVSDFHFDYISVCTIEGNKFNKFVNDEFKANISNIYTDEPVEIPLSECVNEGYTLTGGEQVVNNRCLITNNDVQITAMFTHSGKEVGDIPFTLPFKPKKGSDVHFQDGLTVSLRTTGAVQMYGDYANMEDDDEVYFTANFVRFKEA